MTPALIGALALAGAGAVALVVAAYFANRISGWISAGAALIIKLSVIFIKYVLFALAAALALIWLVVDFNGWIGLVIGAVLGTLTGTARVAGVDFRQWFRDPGTPSEFGDDSWIGMMRFGFHMLASVAFLALIGVIIVASVWPPGTCVARDLSPTLVGWLGAWGEWIGRFIHACTAWTTWYKILVGTALGLGFMQSLATIAWNCGLRYGLPNPAGPTEYLVTRQPPYLRPKRKDEDRKGYRRLIVCCDGTWNWPEWQLETNVVRLVRALEPNDGDVPQIIYYHQGVGTGNFLDSMLGGGTGVGLTASVKACYGFLVDNYRDGDEIFLFGFSRGAYVARALSGLIFQIGMLHKEEMEHFSEVWDWYRQEKTDRKRADLDALVRPENRTQVDIECVGVWDTVGAMGVPGLQVCTGTFKFHDASLGWHVRHAFQALAIDERRGNFQAAIWAPFDGSKLDKNNPEDKPFIPPEPGDIQEIKQVWLPGAHSGIGGGYPQRGLSDASFLWMLGQLHAGDKGRPLLRFNDACVNAALACKEDELEMYPGGEFVESRTGFWSFMWCSVPRPVCIVSDTEYVHNSAFERTGWLRAHPYSRRDPYRRESRQAWCGEMKSSSRRIRFEPFEEATKRPRQDSPKRKDFKVVNTFCSRMLTSLSQKT